MTEYSYEFNVSDYFLKDFKEELWVDQQIVREAWCTELAEATHIINDLLLAFPDITLDYIKSNKSNMIGYASNYRPPYSNGCISWYTWEYPTTQDQLDYNVYLPDGCSLCSWFGKKYDLTTKQVWLKYVFKGKSMPCPSLPKYLVTSSKPFYAMISDASGNVLPEVDVYFYSHFDDVEQYCKDNSLVFPAPSKLNKGRRLWAFVYDYETLNISKVKAYDIFNPRKRIPG
tara:strand:+ start:1426 stop:2112 length:687 start_codon:yes stop_codon:yes gene_type:complete